MARFLATVPGSVRGIGIVILALLVCRVGGALLCRGGAVHPTALLRGGVAPERFTFATGCVKVVDSPCPPGDDHGIEARTVAWMEEARFSLHAALYELSLPAVAAALMAAHLRGIDVRVHSETDSRASGNQARHFAMLQSVGIPLTFDGRPSLMHDKFIVRDGTAVWTGSANLTWPGVHLHYNEALFIDNSQVAALYEKQFAQLQEGREADGGTGQDSRKAGGGAGQEGREADGGTDGIHEVDTPQVRMKVAFAARGPREALFMQAIHSARREIRVAAFSFTHQGLVEALVERASAGVKVEVILDGRNARAAPAQEAARRLQNAGCRVSSARQRPPPELVTSFGLPPTQDVKIHHKLVVVDESVVVTGSANLSVNGLDRNDENVLLLESGELGASYQWVLDRAQASCQEENP